MQELLRLRDNGQLNEIQALWFRERKPKEELYDCINDPHEIENLAYQPEYADKLLKLSVEMDRRLNEIGDQPNLPERELIEQLWQGAGEQPITSNPIVSSSDGKISIECETEGASISYRIIRDTSSPSAPYQVYKEPFTIEIGSRLEIQAHRIGFKPSNSIQYPASL